MNYRGWRSTKLHLALIAMGVVTLVYWRVGFTPNEFATYCTAILAAAGIYSSAATAEKFTRASPAPVVPPAPAAKPKAAEVRPDPDLGYDT